MKRGFTLIELLVVIGIMGMLTTVSIGGYSAMTRGMSERAALNAAAGIVDTALQRAQIDRSRTYLYLFNEVTRIDSDDEAGIVSGVAIAVRPIGRITRVAGDLYCDEFGDLNQSYSSLNKVSEDESQSEQEQSSASVRIYNLRTREVAVVREGVYLNSDQASDLEDGMGRKIKAYGFKKVSGASFQVGDEYGQEFAVMRLPPGYTFSGSVTMSSSSDLGMKQVKVETINATSGGATGGNTASVPSIQVYSRRPDGSFQLIN